MKEIKSAGIGVSALDGAYMLSHGKCSMHIHIARILLGILFIIIGAVLIMIPERGIVSDSNFTSAFYMIGILCCCYGIFYLVTKNSRMVYDATGAPVVHRQLYYDLEEEGAVADFISGAGSALPTSRTQGGIMLRAYVAADGSMACLQSCRYHDLTYETITAPTMLNADNAKAMAEYIKRNK